MRPILVRLSLAVLLTSPSLTRAADAATNSTATLPRTDAHGNPIRRAPTGHISNYDEAKVGAYILPDLLVLQSGNPVRDGKMWSNKRRPEILKLYETEIYGRVPKRAPKVKWEVVETDAHALNGSAIRKHVDWKAFLDFADRHLK